ncbi:multidrug ABC transporter ATP-binding protein [Marinitenerispora sediminis]|uniref:Multidrug ABC transporter ATP-binding protein n=2 Tax=Marinitenerispora sediminis TaxID=1931232 RepID=A0A368T9D7_9ACTN|nr:multidrug ABC transporter ATP-binding protein [Marinitenerispora sediminis]RCV59164.1 multidrug ABC transporter ATP-binding protein [Marinitenerispora sediminis]RCV59191.1 multidrug ABC transporter ATP-binding protein [Marinitenerispora sediminis]
MAHQVGEAMVPVIVGLVIDGAVATGDVRRGLLGLGLLAAVFVAFSWSYRIGARIIEGVAQGAEHELRVELARRVLHPRGGAERGRQPGALLSVATSDAQRTAMLTTAVAITAAAVTALAVTVVALLRVSVPLGLLVAVGLPPVLWLTHALGRPLERRSAVEQARVARAAGLATDLVRGLRVLKGIGAERAAADRYRAASRDSLRATLLAARAEGLYESGAPLVTGAFLALVAYVGGRLALAGDITVGELIAVVGLAQFLIGPMQRLFRAGAVFAQVRASADRVAEVLSAPPAVGAGTTEPADTAGALRLDGLAHGALRGLTLEVAPGEVAGVVVPDQAAATALLDCLGHRVCPAAGAVLLDGVPLDRLAPDRAHAAILVSDHEADLFEGSVLANVTAAARDHGRVPDALAAAAADEVAAGLPDGLDTVVSERGRSLSGGQRQRVALARALAADPPVLVLHDPTSAIDAVTEARVASGLRALRTGRTTVVLTTGPALLAVCDRVVLVLDGGIAATGRHADLVRDNADYRAAVLS